LLSNPAVSELNAVDGARVPLIEFVYDGVSIDLLFARLSTETVPDDHEAYSDDKILKNIDDVTVITLNGPRVTEMYFPLFLIPHIYE
jgi:poly(A) polymerase